MHIFYDEQIFQLEQYGGIARYFFEIISQLLQQHHHEVDISLFQGFHINEYNFQKFQKSFKHFTSIKRPYIDRTYKFFSIINYISCGVAFKSDQYNIYHPTYYGINKLIDRKVKKIITVHDMTQEKFPQMFRDYSKVSNLKAQAIQVADNIITVSETTKKDLINFYNVSEEKIKVIYHANSLKIPLVSERVIQSPYILYVGKRNTFKNFQVLLSGYANSSSINKNFNLVCFGGNVGKKGFNATEQEVIEKFNLSEKVISLSGSDELLANLYTYASVFVFPSLNEGFGIPLLEAMHYGCPVLASNCSSLPEIAQNAAIYFEPNNIEDLMKKLEMILSDTKLRYEIIELGKQREKEFSWEKASKETLKTYKMLTEVN